MAAFDMNFINIIGLYIILTEINQPPVRSSNLYQPNLVGTSSFKVAKVPAKKYTTYLAMNGLWFVIRSRAVFGL
jgi:hypothetical protein